MDKGILCNLVAMTWRTDSLRVTKRTQWGSLLDCSTTYILSLFVYIYINLIYNYSRGWQFNSFLYHCSNLAWDDLTILWVQVDKENSIKSLFNSCILSQTSFSHISISSSTIPTVSTAPESPWKDLSIDTSHVSKQSVMAEILGRSTGNHHGIVY